MIAGLRRAGHRVEVAEVEGAFPCPSGDALERLAGVLAQIVDEAVVVVDGLAFGAAPGPIAREAERVSLVALVHHPLAAETGLEPSTAAALEASERRALACARLVVVTSRATARGLDAYGVSAARIAVVEPGTERGRLAAGSRDGVIRMLSVGSIVPRKGHLVLADALASLRELDWRLTCVGSVDRDPVFAERFRQRLEEYGLEDRVRLTGEAGAAEVDAHYAAADVFVLPTFHEGYGMAVAEALAHGLPVVSTPTGGIADLIAEGSGLLVPPGDARALAMALSRVVSDSELRSRLSEGARRVRERLPTWDDAVARMATAIERARRDE